MAVPLSLPGLATPAWLQHATRSLLTEPEPVLSRIKGRSADPAALAAWQAAVHGLRTAVTSWLAKASKHAMVAYPLLTQLLCLETDDGFQQGIGPLLDTVQKQLRVRLSQR